MFLVIFPKEFEYNKFILTLNSKHKIIYTNRISSGSFHYDVYIVNIEGERYMFCCKVIKDSDVKFLLKFNSFLSQFTRNIKDDHTSVKVLIIGTCGILKVEPKPIKESDNTTSDHTREDNTGAGHNEPEVPPDSDGLNRFTFKVNDRTVERISLSDIKIIQKKLAIGSALFVDKAIKYDRGRIDRTHGNGYDIHSEPEDYDMTECKKLLFKYETKTIASSNFINQSEFIHRDVVAKAYGEREDVEWMLCDMETYDFMECCKFNNYSCVGAIRIISDFSKCACAIRESGHPVEDNIDRKIRIILDFNTCVCAIEDPMENSIDNKNRIISDFNTCARAIEEPMETGIDNKLNRLIRKICHFGSACDKFVTLLRSCSCDYSDRSLSPDCLRKYKIFNDEFDNNIFCKFISDYPVTACTTINNRSFPWRNEYPHVAQLNIHKVRLKTEIWTVLNKLREGSNITEKDMEKNLNEADGLENLINKILDAQNKLRPEEIKLLIRGPDDIDGYANPAFEIFSNVVSARYN